MNRRFLFKQQAPLQKSQVPASTIRTRSTALGSLIGNQAVGRLLRAAKTTDQKGAGAVVPPVVHDVLASSGFPLPLSARRFFEPRFGADFSQVRMHADLDAAKSADAVDAAAYTVGRDIVFADGQYAPHSDIGRKLLAHELTHVVQQQGVRPSLPLRFGNQSGLEEVEASHVAEQIQRPELGSYKAIAPAAAVIQKSKRKSNRRPDRKPKDTENVHSEEKHGKDVAGEGASCATLVDAIQAIVERLEKRAEDLQAHGGGDRTHNDTYDSLVELLGELHDQAMVKCTEGEYDPELIERVELELQFKQGPQVDTPAFTERVKQTLLDIGVSEIVVAAVLTGVIAALLTMNPFPALVVLIGATRQRPYSSSRLVVVTTFPWTTSPLRQTMCRAVK